MQPNRHAIRVSRLYGCIFDCKRVRYAADVPAIIGRRSSAALWRVHRSLSVHHRLHCWRVHCAADDAYPPSLQPSSSETMQPKNFLSAAPAKILRFSDFHNLKFFAPEFVVTMRGRRYGPHPISPISKIFPQ